MAFSQHFALGIAGSERARAHDVKGSPPGGTPGRQIKLWSSFGQAFLGALVPILNYVGGIAVLADVWLAGISPNHQVQ